MANAYHACATCVHFRALRTEGKMNYHCSRLGFETKTNYQFTCWTPKPQVKKLMEKRRDLSGQED